MNASGTEPSLSFMVSIPVSRTVCMRIQVISVIGLRGRFSYYSPTKETLHLIREKEDVRRIKADIGEIG